MRIGEAAALVGVATHVLRHWEDEAVVVPGRTASGHRDYGEEDTERLRIVRACQTVGLSLGETRLILHRDESGRLEVINHKLGAVRRQRAELEAAERFLYHVRECRHELVTRCEDCSAYAASGVVDTGGVPLRAQESGSSSKDPRACG